MGGDSGKACPVEGEEVEELGDVRRDGGSWVREVLSVLRSAS